MEWNLLYLISALLSEEPEFRPQTQLPAKFWNTLNNSMRYRYSSVIERHAVISITDSMLATDTSLEMFQVPLTKNASFAETRKIDNAHTANSATVREELLYGRLRGHIAAAQPQRRSAGREIGSFEISPEVLSNPIEREIIEAALFGC